MTNSVTGAGPRVLFSSDDIDTIRARTTLPLFREFWTSLVEADLDDDRAFVDHAPTGDGFAQSLSRLRRIVRREACVHLITGDPARAELAVAAMRKALDCPMWASAVDHDGGPVGIQLGPDTTISMALAVDWLGDALPGDLRAEALRAIGDKGCEAAARGLRAMLDRDCSTGWHGAPGCGDNTEALDISRWPEILAGTNLQAVPAAALAVGAALLRDTDDRADGWLDLAERGYRSLAAAFKPDGSYPEGVGYCGYTVRLLAKIVEAVERAGGPDLFPLINFSGVVEFGLAMRMPHRGRPHACVNFGDSSHSFGSGVGFWIARRSRSGLAQDVALNHSGGHSIESLIWYDPTVEPESPDDAKHFVRLDLDWIVARTGYEADDLVVAMRSGGPSNHEHADRNSLVLKAYGEVLLADIRGAPYPPDDPAWPLRTSPAHNTVLIDGCGHQYHDGSEGTNDSLAAAEIVKCRDVGDHLLWSSDATPAYQLVHRDVDAVTRTVVLFRSVPLLVVVDKLVKGVEPSAFSARWHVENEDGEGRAAVDGDAFTIERPGARFVGRCAGSGDVRVEPATLPIPVDDRTYAFVEVSLAEPARDGLLILAGCPVRSDDPSPDIRIDRGGHEWRISADNTGGTAALTVRDTGRLPTVDAP
ncbi:MAG: heparinase II/III domain-containing protein [Planctomycetota bacterium]